MATISNISIDQGASFATVINLQDPDGNPMDLTGYFGDSSIRKSYQASKSVEFSVNFDPNRENGIIFISLDAAKTAELEFGRYVWDLLLTNSSGIKVRTVEGIATVNPSVTRIKPVTMPLEVS